MVGLLLSCGYFVWLGVLIFWSIGHIHQMNPEYIFVMVITLITIVGATVAVFTGALAPDQVRLVWTVPLAYRSIHHGVFSSWY